MYEFLLIASVIIFVVVTVFYIRTPQASFFHPVTLYLVLHAIIFTIRPWVAYLFDYHQIYIAYRFFPDAYAKNMTLVMANLGLIVFTTAALWAGNAPMRFRNTRTNAFERSTLKLPFVITFLILQPMFLYGVWLGWVFRATDKSLTHMDLRNGTEVMIGANGYAYGAMNLSVFIIPVLLWVFRFRWQAVVLAGGYLLIMQGMGTRGPSIVAIFCAALFYMYDHRQRWIDWRIIAMAVPLFLLFDTVGADRGKAVRELFTNDTATEWEYGKDFRPLEGADFANMEFMEFLIYTVPRKTGTYEYFVDNLQIFTEPVPRALWKDKPAGQPIRLFNLFDYGSPVGMTRSLPGEGWTQLGIAGVIIWCGLWGWVLGYFYNRTIRSPQGVVSICSYFMMLSLMIVCYRDGMLVSVLRFGLFAIAPLVLWIFVARLMGRQQLVRARRAMDRGLPQNLPQQRISPRKRLRQPPPRSLRPRSR